MPTREILIDGVVVTVETDDEDPSPRRGLVERGAERGVVADKVRDIGQDMRNVLGGVLRPIREALDATQPEQWTIELSLGFKGTAGVPCLTSGEANGAIKVTATWKRQL